MAIFSDTAWPLGYCCFYFLKDQRRVTVEWSSDFYGRIKEISIELDMESDPVARVFRHFLCGFISAKYVKLKFQ